MGYAVVRNLEVLEAEPLQTSANTQGAELTALAKAAWWGHNQRVTTYTASKHAFGVCHAAGMLWKEQVGISGQALLRWHPHNS